jgi:hypothetical protein
VLVLVVSIFVNQFLALRIEPAPPARRKVLLAIGVAVNQFGLGYYKYGTFLWQLAGGAALGCVGAAMRLPRLSKSPRWTPAIAEPTQPK